MRKIKRVVCGPGLSDPAFLLCEQELPCHTPATPSLEPEKVKLAGAR